jgi:hypothetical protein
LVPDNVDKAKRDPKDFMHHRPFDKGAFKAAYLSEFKAVPKFNAGSVPDLVALLELMERDPTITDIRWMAYMLATTFIESSATAKIYKESKDKKGRTVRRVMKVWRNFTPVEEKGHGKGTRYEKPVKVKKLADGDQSTKQGRRARARQEYRPSCQPVPRR